MGYSVYFSDKNNRWQGYGVPAYCDHPGCKNEIDRGMGYVCCGNQDHDNSCGGFYCAEHEELCSIISEDGYFYHCQHKPIEQKEHPNWIKHVSTDESWRQWREENPKLLKGMQDEEIGK